MSMPFLSSRRPNGPVSVLDSAPRGRYITAADASAGSYQRRDRRAHTEAGPHPSSTVFLTNQAAQSARHLGYPLYESFSHDCDLNHTSSIISHREDRNPFSQGMTLSPRRTRHAPYTRSHAHHAMPNIGYAPYAHVHDPYHRDRLHIIYREHSPHRHSYDIHEPHQRVYEGVDRHPCLGRRRSAVEITGNVTHTREVVMQRPSVTFREPESLASSWGAHQGGPPRFGRGGRSMSLGAPQLVEPVTPTSPLREAVERSMNDNRVEGLHPTVMNMLPQEKYAGSVDNCDLPPESITCMVCHCEFNTGEDLLRLPCLHSFHSACINKWLASKNTCPLCRIDVAHELERCVAATDAALRPSQ